MLHTRQLWRMGLAKGDLRMPSLPTLGTYPNEALILEQIHMSADEAALRYIEALDAEGDLRVLAQHGLGIRPECARVLRVLTMLLQKAAARRLTPFHIGSLMCRCRDSLFTTCARPFNSAVFIGNQNSAQITSALQVHVHLPLWDVVPKNENGARPSREGSEKPWTMIAQGQQCKEWRCMVQGGHGQVSAGEAPLAGLGADLHIRGRLLFWRKPLRGSRDCIPAPHGPADGGFSVRVCCGARPRRSMSMCACPLVEGAFQGRAVCFCGL